MAQDEPFGIYESWRNHKIRADRWRIGRNDDSLEITREVFFNNLLMRYRVRGLDTSDSGSVFAQHRLFIKNPFEVNKIAVDFRVVSLAAVGCTANPAFTRVSPAVLDLSKFNDGSSMGPGDMTGDHFIRIGVLRDYSSVEPHDNLTGQAFLYRCKNSTCGDAVSSVFNLDIGKVRVGEKFSLTAIWDPDNHQFLVGLNDNLFPLVYEAALNYGPAISPFATIRMQMNVINCKNGLTEGDASTMVGKVRTNISAVIP